MPVCLCLCTRISSTFVIPFFFRSGKILAAVYNYSKAGVLCKLGDFAFSEA